MALAAMLLVGAWSALPARAGLFHHPLTAPELKAKIAKQRNLVKKAELQMRLAGLILQRAVQAYDANHFRRGETLLNRYLDEARTSWQTLEQSRKNPLRQPEGFMQLDQAFTANDRILGDLHRRIAYPESEVIKKAQTASRNIHGQVLDALFPGLHMRRTAQPVTPSPRNLKRQAGVVR